eukprot:scaffold976_cov122-Isochrysis_galbana.AAC.6
MFKGVSGFELQWLDSVSERRRHLGFRRFRRRNVEFGRIHRGQRNVGRVDRQTYEMGERGRLWVLPAVEGTIKVNDRTFTLHRRVTHLKLRRRLGDRTGGKDLGIGKLRVETNRARDRVQNKRTPTCWCDSECGDILGPLL